MNGFIEELEELPESNDGSNRSLNQDESMMRGVLSDFTSGNNTPYFRIANEILGPIITGSLGGLASSSRYLLLSVLHGPQLTFCLHVTAIMILQMEALPAMGRSNQTVVEEEVKDDKVQLISKIFCKKF